jgi:D-beta-D-heptose 7-phosphate kinase/D-beta-D-heptose 1-phosphate adenosyltransferase
MEINIGDLKLIRDKYRNKKIVFASGVFDLFHVGHLYYLCKAKKLGDILVVNIVNDGRVKYLKGGNRPIINQKQRAEIIKGLV